MKNFTGTAVEFFVVFGLSIASAVMLASILFGALNLNLESASDRNGHITLQDQARE